MIIHQGIITHGGVGDSLVKGIIKQLPAYALSIQPGGVVGEVVIDKGSIATEGDHVIAVQVQGEKGLSWKIAQRLSRIAVQSL